MKKISILSFLFVVFVACQNSKEQQQNSSSNEDKERKDENMVSEKSPEPEIMPVGHASFVMKWDDKVWYNDPVGGAKAYATFPEADVVIISDIHGDHLNVETLNGLKGDFQIIAPQAVFNQLTEALQAKTKIMNNDDELSWEGFNIKAIPMYNITEDRLKFHEKGRGNGYVINHDNFKLYISGDTENIDEMKALKDIDLALVCMNLPYTMSVQQAVDGVVGFSPKRVMPYHYRGLKDGEPHFYDVELFERLVAQAEYSIKVERLNWYPNK